MGTVPVRAPAPVAGDTADDALLRDVRRRMAGGGASEVRSALAGAGRLLGSEALDELSRRARAELFGAGPLQALLETPGVTDVLVNGPSDVWIDRGRGIERTQVDLGTPAAVRALAVRLAAAGRARLDDASPVVDARLPDGTRLHAIVSPVCAEGAVISLRVLRRRALTLDQLVSSGTVPVEWAGLVQGLVAGRANLIVSGGTGTGKTTLLAALLSLVPRDERIVCVEEARELVPDHPHVVPLTARRANVEGAGAVDLPVLVRASLRMRPDRIVLGECRGAEVRDVLMAMNTGHDGSSATLHANAASQVVPRLEALGSLAGMTREAVWAQTAGALDVVLHLRRRAGRRWISEVGVTARSPDGAAAVVAVATWDGEGGVVGSEGWSALSERWAPR
ncbi:hypothetical protein GCM10025865_08010 [Paraoerskovia sediminicola]|uniref:Bacterial type II secretion system protein E domain-containing protein n=1 Tax=Paraoerskovia sediminicola TaxID=1138587 RepID=A0ABM8G0D0_9CELL|nr:hypothetical protein GCM10025865_08010 [Paraoerskovia sediminicola]